MDEKAPPAVKLLYQKASHTETARTKPVASRVKTFGAANLAVGKGGPLFKSHQHIRTSK